MRVSTAKTCRCYESESHLINQSSAGYEHLQEDVFSGRKTRCCVFEKWFTPSSNTQKHRNTKHRKNELMMMTLIFGPTSVEGKANEIASFFPTRQQNSTMPCPPFVLAENRQQPFACPGIMCKHWFYILHHILQHKYHNYKINVASLTDCHTLARNTY